MPGILAHRGNINGPSAADENGLPTIARALEHGWGLEIDIRRTDDGRFYISHDPKRSPDGLVAEAYCELIRRYPRATVALNIKELGYEAELLAFLAEEHVLDQVFLFDMELIEPTPGQTARLLRSLDKHVRLAARVSDRGESIARALGIREASVIWLDEFDGPWSTAADIRRLKSAGHEVWAVSPDLHRFPFTRARARWTDFLTWGVDGICTDYPVELQRVLASTPAAEGRLRLSASGDTPEAIDHGHLGKGATA